MKTKLLVTKEVIDLETGLKITLTATVQSEKDETHKKISLLYEGYISEWKRS